MSGKISSKGAFNEKMYQYVAPWPVYGLDWSKRREEKAFRLALGSFIEAFENKLQVITLSELAYDEPPHRLSNVDFVKIAETDHQYPITKVLWEPYKPAGSRTPDLLATSGDHLRLWEIVDDIHIGNNTIGANNHNGFRAQRLVNRSLLSNTKADFNAPLTSFDWNEVDPSLAVTSSIDTTCTVWNVETNQAKTQLIAHDKEVYDVAFASGSVDVFASVGADGSVRMFDLISLEHSTIIYETESPQPLLRLCFNKVDSNYLSTFRMNSNDIQILDIRVPGIPVVELTGHLATVNCITWSPQCALLCSGGNDSQVFVWNLQNLPYPHSSGTNKVQQDPVLAYNADSEINQLSWSSACMDFVAVGFGKTIQALKV